MKRKLTIVCVCISLALGLAYSGVSYYMMKQVTEPKIGSQALIRSTLIEKYHVDRSQLPFETTMLTNSDGTKIETQLYRNPQPTGKVVVLSHGIQQSGEMMLQFFPMYQAMGFDIVTFSYRNHGESSKSFTSFGKYEVSDLKMVMEFAHQQFGEEVQYTIHGISMGSAIMLQYAKQYKENKQYDYLIADCSFADLGQLLNTRLQIEYPPLSFLPLVSTASFISSSIGRGSFSDIAPKNDVKQIEVPILFIHGKNDDYIPIDHAYALYEAKQGKKQLVEMERGKHAESYLYNKEAYETAVKTFYQEN